MPLKKILYKLLSGKDQKELVAKAGVFVFFRVAALILGYGFTLMVIHYFGNEVYGMVVLGFTLFMVLSIAGKLGYDVSLTRYVAAGNLPKNELSGYLAQATIRSFLVCAILATPMVLFDEWIASRVFNRLEFAPFLRWTALTFPIWSLIYIHNGIYRGLKKNTLFSIYAAFGRFLLTIGVLLAGVLFFGNRYDELPIVAHFIAIFLLWLSCCWFTYRVFGYSLYQSLEGSFRKFNKESRPILITSVLGILLIWIDRLFVGAYLDESDVAVYDVGAKLALLISFNLDAINSILAPKIVELYRKDDVKPLQTLLTFAVGISAAIALGTFLVILLGKDILLRLFGEAYLSGSGVLLILGVGQLLNCFCGSVGNILQMTGHQKTHQKIMLIGLIVNLTLNFALVQRFGIEGVAIATIASLLTWNFLGAYYVKKRTGLRSYLDPLALLNKINRNG
ncbi:MULTISPECIES: flippase [unclassified Robiginitalea]|uniref:flippase n=1 Tax=Robiginitalea TaxID=252306 RepID=UPI00234AEB31|nr:MULTISPECIES: flippase [unclassified Robiginitalea]MDC6353196.1 flippase [Robiginitalea sp. PM2]MDC6373637.1 flippase [Robiginitalea sp. SP8]